MRIRDKIKGILFDSGNTLVRPLTGAWWPGQRFDQLLSAHGIDARPSDQQLRHALQKGIAYLSEHHHLLTEAEEYEEFQIFYRIILGSLGLPCSSALLTALAADIVYGLDFEPYPDVHPMLAQLQQAGLRLGLVSNAWPSLERKYQQLNLRAYFSAFVISAQVGCMKPDERIFQHAVENLHLPPNQTLFVDDVPEYVDKAISLGLSGLVIMRQQPVSKFTIPAVTSLEEIGHMFL